MAYFLTSSAFMAGVVAIIGAAVAAGFVAGFSSPQPTKTTVKANAIADNTNLRMSYPSSKKWFTKYT